MADMKLDETALRVEVEKAGERAQGMLEEHVRAARKEVAEVVRALRDTPDSTLKLFEMAAVAQVTEVDYSNVQHWVRARVETAASSIGLSDNSREVTIPAGKYRALFFLVKVEK